MIKEAFHHRLSFDICARNQAYNIRNTVLLLLGDNLRRQSSNLLHFHFNLFVTCFYWIKFLVYYFPIKFAQDTVQSFASMPRCLSSILAIFLVLHWPLASNHTLANLFKLIYEAEGIVCPDGKYLSGSTCQRKTFFTWI